MWGQYLFILVLASTAFPSLIPLEILVTNHTSIEDGTFVFKYQVGQDAVIPLSFTPKVLNVNEVEVIWEFKTKSDQEMEKIFIFYEKPHSFKERVEFSGNIYREDVSITIHNTSSSDSGYYTCHVFNYNSMKVNEKTVLLEIFPRETANAFDALNMEKGVLFDTDSKVVFIVIVLCMVIIFVCTLISLVKRRQTKKKEETDNGILKDNEDNSNEEKV